VSNQLNIDTRTVGRKKAAEVAKRSILSLIKIVFSTNLYNSLVTDFSCESVQILVSHYLFSWLLVTGRGVSYATGVFLSEFLFRVSFLAFG